MKWESFLFVLSQDHNNPLLNFECIYVFIYIDIQSWKSNPYIKRVWQYNIFQNLLKSFFILDLDNQSTLYVCMYTPAIYLRRILLSSSASLYDVI